MHTVRNSSQRNPRFSAHFVGFPARILPVNVIVLSTSSTLILTHRCFQGNNSDKPVHYTPKLQQSKDNEQTQVRNQQLRSSTSSLGNYKKTKKNKKQKQVKLNIELLTKEASTLKQQHTTGLQKVWYEYSHTLRLVGTEALLFKM